MSNTNNDSYTVNQSNGASDNDQNMNGISLDQFGGVDIGVVNQDIQSGGNTQYNTSNVFDTGLPTSSNHAQNDDYTVGQSNNLFDSDHDMNVFDVNQTGGANVVFANQHIDSGGNEQTDTSNIFDGGYTGGHSNNSSNDTYDVTQFNGLRDEDTNGNALHLDQASPGLWSADLAFVSQNESSGGNTQSNNALEVDSGFSGGSSGWGGGWGSFSFGGGHGGGYGGSSSADSNNDDYSVDQSNMGLDNDTNYNIADFGQLETANIAFLNQDIQSGGNSESNSSNIFDTGFSYYSGHNNDDTYKVGQENQLSDNDGNANKLTLDQMYAVNINGVNQSIDSGGNQESNSANTFDFGSVFGSGGGGGWLSFGGGHGGGGYGGSGDTDNNDSYDVNQGNMMLDNDINLNIGIVAQVGFGNAATIDQDIYSGGNTQTNDSDIFDTGFGGSHSNNDTYDLRGRFEKG